MLLTENERKVLRLLASTPGKEDSINQVAKNCSMTPNGVYKLLTKLEKEGILKVKPIANIKAYKLNWEEEKTIRVLELAFIPTRLEGRVKMRADDLKLLKTATKASLLFGSYITSKSQPTDLDVLFIIERKDYESYKKVLTQVQDITPIRIQDLVQTREDLVRNIKKGDPVIANALQKGTVLWGTNVLVEAMKDAAR